MIEPIIKSAAIPVRLWYSMIRPYRLYFHIWSGFSSTFEKVLPKMK